MNRNLLAAIGCLQILVVFPCPGEQAEKTPKKSLPAWPGFRGAGGNGHAIEASPPIAWNAKEAKNILWKTAIDRHGMSSPVISGERLFLTAADHLVRQILCFDTNTGKLLWEHGVDSVAEHEIPRVLEETGYAAPTPITNGDHIVAVFATGELVCVNLRGERVWSKQVGIPKNHYGHASSLISDGDRVIVQYDQKENSKLLAFEIASGKPAWEVKRDAISWSSPILVDNNDRAEVILTNCKAVDSYDPKSGKLLWRVECLYGEVAPSAAYADGTVFVASEGAPATALDVRKHDEEPKTLWEWDEALPDAASPVATKDLLIVPTAFGVVTCLDAKTGKALWEHEFDKGFNSSPIVVGDRVYITDMSGTTQIFRMGKKFELMGTASVNEAVYATPAFSGDQIFVRGLTHLYCIKNQE